MSVYFYVNCLQKDPIWTETYVTQIKVSFVFFLFCIGLDELVELGEFNQNQSRMTEGYCASHSQLALWCSGYDS